MTTLDQQLDQFLTWHQARVLRSTGRAPAALTLSTKKSKLRTACQEAAVGTLEALSGVLSERSAVEDLLDKLASRMTTGAVAVAVYALLDFGRYAISRGWVESLALSTADAPPANPQKAITVYTQNEVELLLASARGRNLRWWAFLTTLAETGRRVGEVLALEWGWLNLTADVPHFALPTSKNGRQQYVPLTKVLREEVFIEPVTERLLHQPQSANTRFTRDPAVFPFPYSYVGALQTFKRHCATVGVECRGFHNFRHTKATELLSKGVPIQAVSALLGHASVQTTDRVYNHATALSFAHYND